tara:strand:- start:1490 stop:1948 length:459 start_codon:yes stop_codon:yes gene_type:complete
MTHIELKKYFDTQREMPAKLNRAKLPDIAKRVFWEKNQYVTHNPKIDAEQIISKTSTDKFPASATTIRFHSLKNKVIGAYFYGKMESRNYGNNSWTYPSSKLTVTFPNTNPSNGRTPWGYSYQGELNNGMSRKEVDATLDYIEGVMKDFLNL